MQPLSTSMKRLPVLGAPVGPVISTADRFAKDFWLSPRTVLTRKTPMSKLSHFCIRHGKREPVECGKRRAQS